MKILILYNLILLCSIYREAQDEYNVINILGAPIYSEPDFDAQIVGRVDFGESLNVEEVFEEKVTKKISEDLDLEGAWIQVRLDFNYGYVFSGDFSTKSTTLILEHGDLETVSLLGKELKKETSTKQLQGEFGLYSIVNTSTYFEKGRLEEEISDGCHSWEYHLENFTLSEAYHQLMNFTVKKHRNQIELPAIISREGNIWNFSDLDAIQELQLHDLGSRKFKNHPLFLYLVSVNNSLKIS